MARFVNPNDFVWFAFVALGAPLIYLGSILLFLIWIIRWRVWAILIALPLIPSMFTVGEFYQLPTMVDYSEIESHDASEFSIMSYNVFTFKRYRESGSTMDSILKEIQMLSPDVVCFQEFYVRDSSELNIIDSKMSSYPYRAFQREKDMSLVGYIGAALFSKYPFLESEYKTFAVNQNGYIIADIVRKTDTIKLVNCHLQTTDFNRVSKNRSLGELLQSDTSEHVTEKLVDTFASNFRKRALQADSLKMAIDSSQYPVFVAGDFNSPPMTYSYYTLRGDLEDSFCSSGSGYGSTYRPMKGLLRIDYLFYDPLYYESLSYDSFDWEYSDHRPVLVNFRSVENSNK